jgi:hypothetical protein
MDPDFRDEHFSAYSKLSQLTDNALINISKVNLCDNVASEVNDVINRDDDESNNSCGNKKPDFIVNNAFAAIPLMMNSGCVDIP